MKRSILLVSVLLSLCLGAGALTIYEIQYTSSRGVDNSFPSPYLGKVVSVEGVVTAAGYRNSGFFLSENVSGAWRGIFVQTNSYTPSVGSYVRLTGEVAESYGMTCLQDIRNYRVLDRNRPLPKPVIISTGQLENPHEAEAYEGVYARLINSSVSSAKSASGKFMVTDGSGQCRITLGAFGTKPAQSPAAGTQYAQIAGIVTFGYGEYNLNPFSASDLQIQQPVSTQNRSWGKIKSIYK